jgi:hypothetical protein
VRALRRTAEQPALAAREALAGFRGGASVVRVRVRARVRGRVRLGLGLGYGLELGLGLDSVIGLRGGASVNSHFVVNIKN